MRSRWSIGLAELLLCNVYPLFKKWTPRLDFKTLEWVGGGQLIIYRAEEIGGIIRESRNGVVNRGG